MTPAAAAPARVPSAAAQVPAGTGLGAPPLRVLRTHTDLDALLAGGGAALIFKHSTTCGVSAGAYRALQSALAAGHLAAAAVGMVRVVEDRPLSQAIAQRFGVPHASPQALVVKGGRVVWRASHGAITPEALGVAVRSASVM